jgi:hypothetical protein
MKQSGKASPEFAEAKSKAMARSKAATKAAQRRAAPLLAEVDAIEISVTRISLPTLRSQWAWGGRRNGSPGW